MELKHLTVGSRKVLWSGIWKRREEREERTVRVPITQEDFQGEEEDNNSKF